MSCDLLKFANEGIRSLSPYQPGKPISELEREYGIHDIIKLASNENPLGPSPAAIAAVRDNLSEMALYPDGNSFDLKQALARKHGVLPSQVTTGNGSNDLLELLARVFVAPGRTTLFARHSFAVYPIVTRICGGQSVETPVLAADSERPFAIDFEAMAQAIDASTVMIFIANPNNPTGSWAMRDELYSFIRNVPERILVVVDEAYTEYAVDPLFPDATSWLNDFPNLAVTRTFSKVYGLAGLRFGYALTSPEVADLLNRARQPFNVNLAAQIGALAALDDTEHLTRSIEMNRSGMDQLMDGFRRFGVDFIPSAGNFLCFRVGPRASAIYESLLRQGVIVRPVASYQLPDYLRVTIGTQEQNSRFLDALHLSLS